ncbi:unnamed protein product [Urochloa humidicola]
MNSLHRPPAAARREPSLGGGINGLLPVEVDLSIRSGDGSGSRLEALQQPSGGGAAGSAASHAVAAPGGIGVQASWPSSAAHGIEQGAEVATGGRPAGIQRSRGSLRSRR